MIIFKKAIPRRTILRGLGTTLALPLLDAMVPAAARAQDLVEPPMRFATAYVPNGVMLSEWTPNAVGTDFELPLILNQLAPFRDQMLVVSGLNHENGRAKAGENSGDHARAGASYLTGAHPKKTEGADVEAGISIDQIIAAEAGKHTQLSSLELCVDSPELLGQCEAGYTCAYMNTICWRTPTTPMPMENRPRVVFERLFGDSESTDPAVRLQRIQEDRSILDSVTQKAARLNADLGHGDQMKIGEYLEAIRDVERRIQTAEDQSDREMPTLERPTGIPDTFTDHAKLMFDLQVLAYQTDLTRVGTFMLGREFGGRTYREIGIPDGYHSLTHHQYKQDKIDKVVKIQMYHAQHVAYFLDRLASTPDGDGSLLDHTMVLYGAGLSDANSHLHDNLPTVLLGGAKGHLQGGRHLAFPGDPPLTNLFMTMLDWMDLPQERIGDSTGRLSVSSSA